MQKIVSTQLNTGGMMPQIGFGTWQIEEGTETKNSVAEALRAGYRLIDTAMIYGNERSVGEGFKASDLRRDEVFITTKLWNDDQGYESALTAFNNSLERLNLGFIDLYLIHWPTNNSQARADSWRALSEIYSDGRAKAIGVSNYNIQHLEELLADSEVTPAVNQIPFHPFIYRQQKEVLDFCRKHEIVVEAYSPLARARDLDNSTFSQIAAKHGKSNAQVMLRWTIQHGTVPIPKSSNPERIKENLEVFDFELSDDDMEEINNLS